MNRVILWVVLGVIVLPNAQGADWPMWGGEPTRNMINTAEKNIPTTWDIKTGRNIKWTAKLGSQTYGNPVISKGKIFLGTNKLDEMCMATPAALRGSLIIRTTSKLYRITD